MVYRLRLKLIVPFEPKLGPQLLRTSQMSAVKTSSLLYTLLSGEGNGKED